MMPVDRCQLSVEVRQVLSPGGIGKIPLNPPFQKGEAVGMPGFVEMFQSKVKNQIISEKYRQSTAR